MATSQATANITLVSGEALTRSRFVQIDSATLAIEAADATSLVGVSAETVISGDNVPITTNNGSVVPIELGATLAIGARVMSNGTGQAIASATAGSLEAGYLLDGGDSGEIVRMVLQITRRHAA